MRKVGRTVALLALFACAGYVAMRLLLPGLQRSTSKAPPPGARPEAEVPATLHVSLVAAGSLEAAARFREALSQHAGQPHEAALRRLFAARAAEVAARLPSLAEPMLEQYRYRSAAELVRRYQREWRGTEVEGAADRLLATMLQEQKAQVDSRIEEADLLLDDGRGAEAREALTIPWEIDPSFDARLEDARLNLERRLRDAASAAAPAATPAALAAGRREPSLPPPMPGSPHPDVKRLREARALHAKARELFSRGRYQPAADALKDLVGYYGDLRFVESRRDSAAAMNALARHATQGVAGLFNATSVKRDGKRLKLNYRFDSDAEMLDWETLKTIPHEEAGTFERGRSGVRGSGATSLLLRGFFRNDVRMRCIAQPSRLQSHGLAFSQAGLETRLVMLLVTNHWFWEGENYVLKRPGHCLLMFGKGVNNDVPVDAPDIGFIFIIPSIEKPSPPAGADVGLSFSIDGLAMTGDVALGMETGTLRAEAKGDDGRGIERLRPTLFVHQNAVLFRDVTIEGTPHPDFEKERLAELLRMAE